MYIRYCSRKDFLLFMFRSNSLSGLVLRNNNYIVELFVYWYSNVFLL
jgi:hypothetical protein